jgi:hypothetical protein
MPLIIALTVIIQAFFIWHVFSTGRPYWWAFVILSFPVMGSDLHARWARLIGLVDLTSDP